jgi:uncharacterized membrane protein
MEPVIKGHPIHATLIPLPVGTLPASYVLDVLAQVTGSDKLADAAFYNMLVGSASAIPAALTGFWDFTQMEGNDPAHKTAVTHGLMNGGLIALYSLNIMLRLKNRRSKLGFALSSLAMGGLLVSGYLGGEIAYGRGWRVRSAERFELKWQKENQTGPFKPEGSQEPTIYPEETVKGMHVKESGEAVMKEIEQTNPVTGETQPKVKLLNQTTTTDASKKAKVRTGGADDAQSRQKAAEGKTLLDKPSQAEGDRDTVDNDLDGAVAAPQSPTINQTPDDVPSQAEGDRSTVDADLSYQPPNIAQG